VTRVSEKELSDTNRENGARSVVIGPLSYRDPLSHRLAERALRNVFVAESGDHAAMDVLNPEVLSRQWSQPWPYWRSQ
jgi:hypothetical protein